MYSVGSTVLVSIVMLMSEGVLGNNFSGDGSVVGGLLELVGWDLDFTRRDEWDLDIVVVWVLLIDGPWHLFGDFVCLLVVVGLGGSPGGNVLLSVVRGALDRPLSVVWDSAGDLEWDSLGLVCWDLSIDGVLLVFECGHWDEMFLLEGFLVPDGLWNSSLNLVLFGVVHGLRVIFGDGVWDLPGAGDSLLNPDDLWVLFVDIVLFVIVLSVGDLSLDIVVLVLVLNVGLLLVNLVWDLSGGGVGDLLVDSVWNLLVNGVVLGVVLDTVLNITFLVLDPSWNLDFLLL